jgi:hypothetical protein
LSSVWLSGRSGRFFESATACSNFFFRSLIVSPRDYLPAQRRRCGAKLS